MTSPLKRWTAVLLAGLVAMATAFLVAPGLASATGAPTEVWVDASTGSNANAGTSDAPLATIAAGVTTVASGGTVHVAAGTYNESLTVDKPITLDGAQQGVDARSRSGAESVITGSGGIVYTAGATTGTIDGFTLQGYTGSTSEIKASDVGSGWNFSNNIIDVSYGGIYVNSDGVSNPATTTISHDSFVQSVPSSASSGYYGGAVNMWSQAGNTADNVTVSNNSFTNLSGPTGAVHAGSSPSCTSAGPGTSPGTYDKNLTVTGNTFTETGTDENFLVLFCTSGATITGNTVTVNDPGDNDNASTGMYLGGGNYTMNLSSNTLTADGLPAGAISLNSIFNPGGTGDTISGNTIEGWTKGVQVAGGQAPAPSGFSVTNNTVTGAAAYGVEVLTYEGNMPTGGTVSGNTASGSGTDDCYDNTTGSGTAGTGNTWTGNVGLTSSPAGLCHPSTVYVATTGSDTNTGTQASPFATVQHAIDTVASGGTVDVAAGTYNETPVITQPVTLLGANSGTSPNGGSRGAESILTSASSGQVYGVNIESSGVTVDGFTISLTGTVTCSTCSAFGVQVGPVSSGATVTNNIITGMTTSGTSPKAGNPIGVDIGANSSTTPNNVSVTNNLIENIASLGSQHISAQGIQVGDSTSHPTGTGLVISGNHFTGISSASWGGYGIIFNRTTTGSVISGNTFDSISGGGWARAIGVEGAETSLTVQNNDISGVSSPTANAAADLYFENLDTKSATAVVSNNRFAPSSSFGVANAYASGTADVSHNWWACLNGPNGGTGCSSTYGSLTASPWILSYTADPTKAGLPGFWPTAITNSSAPAFTSGTSTTFTTGSAGSFTVTATGNPAPTYSETGTLPSGVTLNSTTGVLTGTPTTRGSFPITITATNGVSPDATQSFTLTVNDAPVITSAASTTFTTGSAGSFTVTATGYPAPTFSKTAGTLPPGVTLDSTGVLSGTPTAGAGGSYPITITVTNGVSPDATQSFTLTVNDAPVITSAASTTFTTGSAGSFTVTATGYPVPTYSESGTLPPGVTLDSTTGVLSGNPTARGSFPITITATNGVSPDATQAFTLTVNDAPVITSAASTTFTTGSAGSFTVTATGYPAPTFSKTGNLPSGVTLNSTTGVLSGTPTARGSFPITITATNGVSPDATQSFTLTVNDAPVITSGASTTFTTGSAGSFTVTATGYPAPTFSKTGTLPSGVTLNSTTGVLAGTPATNGSYPITITATNGVSPNATQSFTLTVNDAPVITSGASTTFTKGSAGSFTVTATGYPVPTYSETGTLPPGVTLNSTTGVLSGNPTASGSFPISIKATNGVSPDATQSFTLTVDALPAITSAATTTFVATVAGSFTVTATGNPAPTFSETGTLPSGVTLNGTTGVLSGTAATPGTYGITITASNGTGTNATQSFTLVVATTAPTFTSSYTGTAVVGVPYTFTIRAIGLTPLTLSTPSLNGITAAGFTFTDNGNGTATLSGTAVATAVGSKTWTWKATNSAGSTLQGFTLGIEQAPSITSAASKSVKTGASFSVKVVTKGYPVAHITATGIPSGVTLVDGGQGYATLSGVMPAGVHVVTITAANGVAPNATQNFTLTGK